MRYSLRSLMIVMLVLPPLLAAGWWGVLVAITPVERAEMDSATLDALVKAMEEYERYVGSQP